MKLPESFDRAMRDLRRAQIPVYAGNAAFFLVLSFLPLLTLLLAALQYTVFRPEDLLALLSRIMPDEVLPLFSDFLQKAYQKSGAAIISLSALTAAWSASRGIYGISKGLSAVLDVPETRSYLRLRLLCLFYMLLFVLGLVLTLLFHVFGQRLLALLTRKGLPLAGMLSFLLERGSCTMQELTSRIPQVLRTSESNLSRQDLKMLQGMTTSMHRSERHFLPSSLIMPFFFRMAPTSIIANSVSCKLQRSRTLMTSASMIFYF